MKNNIKISQHPRESGLYKTQWNYWKKKAQENPTITIYESKYQKLRELGIEIEGTLSETKYKKSKQNRQK